jgi:hypothetical protein
MARAVFHNESTKFSVGVACRRSLHLASFHSVKTAKAGCDPDPAMVPNNLTVTTTSSKLPRA